MYMKKITLTILFILSIGLIFGQKPNSEYRYIGFKFNANHNISLPPLDNNYVLIKSPYGDLLKTSNEIFSYTPGGGGSIVFNFDFKNEKAGIVIGVDVQNIGFKNHYASKSGNFLVTNQYRTLQVGVPLLIKFWGTNIYKNQSYMTLGIQLNQYFMTKNIQTSSWNTQMYVGNIAKEELKKSSISAMLGFNYNIYFFNLQLNSSNFVNPEYMTQTAEGNVSPYKHFNIYNNFYIQTGVNIPMTRWLTARNWTAEKIRRFFKRSQ